VIFWPALPCLTSDQSCLNLTSSQRYIVDSKRGCHANTELHVPALLYSVFDLRKRRLRAERFYSGEVPMPKLKRHQRKYLFEVASLAFARGQ
jgi:hypothetical protein